MKISCAVPFQVAQQNHYATLSIDVTNRLAQGWNNEGSKVINAWDNRNGAGGDANAQPILKPNIVVGGGFALDSAVVTWYRLDKATDVVGDSTKIIEITLNNTDTESDCQGGDYRYNSKTGALRIVRNLASSTNQDADTFVCKVTGSINGTPLANAMMRAVQVNILPVGSDGYLLVIDAHNGTTAQKTALSANVTETWLRATLIAVDGSTPSTTPVYTWKKGLAAFTPSATNGANIVKVTRDNVDWQEVFTCEVSVGGAQVGVASITITDQADDYQVEGQLTGEIGDSSSATLTWQLYKDTVDGTGAGELQAFFPTGSTVNFTVTALDLTTGVSKPVTSGTMQESANGKHTITGISTSSVPTGTTAGTFYIEVTW